MTKRAAKTQETEVDDTAVEAAEPPNEPPNETPSVEENEAEEAPPVGVFPVPDNEDLAEVFNFGYNVVTHTVPPTSKDYVLAHNSGYRLRADKETGGWIATKR